MRWQGGQGVVFEMPGPVWRGSQEGGVGQTVPAQYVRGVYTREGERVPTAQSPAAGTATGGAVIPAPTGSIAPTGPIFPTDEAPIPVAPQPGLAARVRGFTGRFRQP